MDAAGQPRDAQMKQLSGAATVGRPAEGKERKPAQTVLRQARCSLSRSLEAGTFPRMRWAGNKAQGLQATSAEAVGKP